MVVRDARMSNIYMKIPLRLQMGQVRQDGRLGLTDLYQPTHTHKAHSTFVY